MVMSESRLSNNAHFTFLGVNGEDLIIKLDEYGIAASTGSACSVNTQKASHVLESMGFLTRTNYWFFTFNNWNF